MSKGRNGCFEPFITPEPTDHDNGSDTAALAAHIRQRRRSLQLTQQQLAELAETSNTYICKLERGEHMPTLRVLAKVFEALEGRLIVSAEYPGEDGQKLLASFAMQARRELF